MKKQNLDFEIERDFFIEIKYFKQIVAMLEFVILDIGFALREKCPHTKFLFWSVFSPNMGKYGPEKTPYLDTFHAIMLSKVIGYDHDITQHMHCIMLL